MPPNAACGGRNFELKMPPSSPQRFGGGRLCNEIKNYLPVMVSAPGFCRWSLQFRMAHSFELLA